MRIALLALLLFAIMPGCARIPKPVGHQYSVQQKLEAADHWRELAQAAIKNLPSRLSGPLHVSGDDRSPFGRAFATFLRHEALVQGVPLSTTREGATVLDWGVSTVRHRAERTAPATYPGQFTLLSVLGAGAGYFVEANDALPASVMAVGLGMDAAAAYAEGLVEPTDTEVLINLTTVKDDALIGSYLAVYYVNPEDAGHYWDRPALWAKPEPLPEKRFTVTGIGGQP